MRRRILVSQLALAVLLVGLVSSRAQDSKAKPADPSHGLTLKYRKTGETDFKPTQKYAVECFKDQSGNGIYITQTGALCAVPKSLFKTGDGKDPLFQHGLEFSVRKADGKTASFAAEVF